MADLICWLMHRWWGQLILVGTVWGIGYASWSAGLHRGYEIPFSRHFRGLTRRRLEELEAADRAEEEAEDDELEED